MPFTQPTLTQAQAALAVRLQDPTSVRWVAAEQITYIQEALRWWNAMTSLWRESAAFALTIAQTFYQLPTVLPTLRAYTVTNWDLVADLQYALLEPAAAGGTWTGTAQFDLATLTAAIQRRRDQFLRETGAVLTEYTSAQVANASGRFELAENLVNLRHVDWTVNLTTLRLPLSRTDEWAANAFRPTWVTPAAQPRWYSVTATPPLFVQVIPPPLTDGVISGIAIQTGATIDPLVELPLGIPDDWCWVIKYGALADLLQQDGLALDPKRAQYAQQRWAQGVDMASKASVVLTSRINDRVVQQIGLDDADNYSPLWSLVTGVPAKIVQLGHNLIGSWPPPGGGGPYVVTLDVIRNAPVPILGTDILQIGQDVYDSILDYAQHLALFKEGGGQLELSLALLMRAGDAAGVELEIQQANQPSRAPLLKQSTQEEHAQARQLDAVPAE